MRHQAHSAPSAPALWSRVNFHLHQHSPVAEFVTHANVNCNIEYRRTAMLLKGLWKTFCKCLISVQTRLQNFYWKPLLQGEKLKQGNFWL